MLINDNQAAETEVQLTPAEMFMNDLNAPDEGATPQNVEVSESEGAETPPEAGVTEEGSTEGAPPQETPASQLSDGSTNEDMRGTIAALLDIIKLNQAGGPVGASTSTEEPPAEESPVEEPEFDETAFNEQFYANPAGAIRELARQIADKNLNERLSGLQEELTPLLEESKAAQHRDSIKRALGTFLDSTPDADDYFDAIAAYIRDNSLPEDDIRSYQDAYRESKLATQNALIEQLRQASAGRNLDDYLADESSVAHIIANDNIKSKVIENYLKELQEGGRPATIQGGGSAQIPGTPAAKADSLKGASELFLRDLNM